jgi:hypothetical protein
MKLGAPSRQYWGPLYNFCPMFVIQFLSYLGLLDLSEVVVVLVLPNKMTTSRLHGNGLFVIHRCSKHGVKSFL